jgi:ribosome-associated translation inhibitor RaiA
MKLSVQHRDIRSTDPVDTLIEEHILALQPRLQIDEAVVRLEHRAGSSPAFHISVHLVTPGPDVFAESDDHTVRAAVEKVMKQVRDKITDRHAKRARKLKSNLSAPAPGVRGKRAS